MSRIKDQMLALLSAYRPLVPILVNDQNEIWPNVRDASMVGSSRKWDGYRIVDGRPTYVYGAGNVFMGASSNKLVKALMPPGSYVRLSILPYVPTAPPNPNIDPNAGQVLPRGDTCKCAMPGWFSSRSTEWSTCRKCTGETPQLPPCPSPVITIVYDPLRDKSKIADSSTFYIDDDPGPIAEVSVYDLISKAFPIYKEDGFPFFRVPNESLAANNLLGMSDFEKQGASCAGSIKMLSVWYYTGKCAGAVIGVELGYDYGGRSFVEYMTQWACLSPDGIGVFIPGAEPCDTMVATWCESNINDPRCACVLESKNYQAKYGDVGVAYQANCFGRCAGDPNAYRNAAQRGECGATVCQNIVSLTGTSMFSENDTTIACGGKRYTQTSDGAAVEVSDSSSSTPAAATATATPKPLTPAEWAYVAIGILFGILLIVFLARYFTHPK